MKMAVAELVDKVDTDKVIDEPVDKVDTVDTDKVIDEPVDTVDIASDSVTIDDIKFPENAEVDSNISDKFLALVNDTKMSTKERAQGIVDLQQELYTASLKAHQEKLKTWENETRTDKEIAGSTGDKLDENLAIAKKGMEYLKIEGLSKLLDESGLGNHKIFIKAFLKIGNMIKEDSFKTGDKGMDIPKKTTAEILYG